MGAGVEVCLCAGFPRRSTFSWFRKRYSVLFEVKPVLGGQPPRRSQPCGKLLEPAGECLTPVPAGILK